MPKVLLIDDEFTSGVSPSWTFASAWTASGGVATPNTTGAAGRLEMDSPHGTNDDRQTEAIVEFASIQNGDTVSLMPTSTTGLGFDLKYVVPSEGNPYFSFTIASPSAPGTSLSQGETHAHTFLAYNNFDADTRTFITPGSSVTVEMRFTYYTTSPAEAQIQIYINGTCRFVARSRVGFYWGTAGDLSPSAFIFVPGSTSSALTRVRVWRHIRGGWNHTFFEDNFNRANAATYNASAATTVSPALPAGGLADGTTNRGDLLSISSNRLVIANSPNPQFISFHQPVYANIPGGGRPTYGATNLRTILEFVWVSGNVTLGLMQGDALIATATATDASIYGYDSVSINAAGTQITVVHNEKNGSSYPFQTWTLGTPLASGTTIRLANSINGGTIDYVARGPAVTTSQDNFATVREFLPGAANVATNQWGFFPAIFAKSAGGGVIDSLKVYDTQIAAADTAPAEPTNRPFLVYSGYPSNSLGTV